MSVRIEHQGHTAEGEMVATDEGFAFRGVIICGPHDGSGNHVEEPDHD